MKSLLYIILFLSLSACSKEEQPVVNVDMRTHMTIAYINKQGQNLLDEKTPGHYSINRMKLYFMEGDKKTLVNNPLSDAPNGIALNNENLPIRISVTSNAGYKGDIISESADRKIGQSTALLEINENITDTIKIEWQQDKSYLGITKIWYNNNLVYDPQTGVIDNTIIDGFMIEKDEQ